MLVKARLDLRERGCTRLDDLFVAHVVGGVRSRFDPLPQKRRKIFGIIRADPQRSALLKADHQAITAPQVPNPTASDAHVNTPSVEKKRPSDLDLNYITVTFGHAEQWNGAKTNSQQFALVNNGQMVERRSVWKSSSFRFFLDLGTSFSSQVYCKWRF